MFNLHFSGSTNNFNSKVKAQHTNSITQNTKLNQYLEKNRKIHKSPAHFLNKSQNISGAKNAFKTNIKNKIINHNNKTNLNAKKIVPLQNLKNFHLINKSNNSIKINTLQYQTNNNNLSISKNNSLSNYFTKTCNNKTSNLRRNNTNTNILKMQNNTNYISTTSNFINNNFYHKKSNIYKLKKSPITKIKDYLATDDFIINKNNNINRNSSLYQLAITEESKKKININDKKSRALIKKTESVSNTFIKKNHSSIKKVKTSSTSILNKKNNFILNINNNIIKNNNSNKPQNKSRVQPNILGNPVSSSGGFIENLSTEKTSGCARMDNFELKIMNEIKEIKNCKSEEKNNKIKLIFEEAIDYIIPKESQNIFLLLLKEICQINNEYYENMNNLKDMVEHLKNKINIYDNKYTELVNKFKCKEKELNNLKKEVEKFYKEKNNKFNNEITNKNQIKNKKILSIDYKGKRDNSYFKGLNMKNIDDLDALYFFDKIEYNQNDKNKKLPKLNLEENYIEKCIQKEIIKRNEVNLTPFQKIALQFEMSDT